MNKLQPGLNYDKHDPKFILLRKVFKFIENEKIKDIYNHYGITKRSTFVIYLKIFFMHIFFSYRISDVVNELNRSSKLRKFAGISEVPNENQVYEYLSRYDPETYCKIVNSILRKFFKPHKRRKDVYITDATPVECDINILRKYITQKHLKKLRLKFGYSNSKGYFIGYKVTVVLEKTTRTPVSILIHPGAPNDSKIFDEVLKELKRRSLIKPKDLIYFDRGYFSYENYKIGINKYKIIPVIFPKDIFKINKFQDQMSYSLMVYKNKKEIKENKKLFRHLMSLLLIKLKNWKDYKPIRGIIEDFFKAAKGAFGLGKFHSFTDKSMYKNIYLCLLLTAIVVQNGFKTKTQLQQLAEGKIEFKPPKNKNTKNNKKTKETQEKSETQHKTEQQQLEIEQKETATTLDSFQ